MKVEKINYQNRVGSFKKNSSVKVLVKISFKVLCFACVNDFKQNRGIDRHMFACKMLDLINKYRIGVLKHGVKLASC